MTEAVSVPRFRSAKRLIQWMERNWHRFTSAGLEPRLPPEIEGVFLRTKKDSPKEVAACIARYSGWAGRMGPEFEEVLKQDHDSLVAYIRNLVHGEEEYDESLLEVLAGDSRNLYRVAKEVGRLPEHLESTITDPRYAFLYSKEVLRGRLPSEMEHVFFTDAYFAAKYAFEVIRGFSPCRLPESLHNMMVMKSFEEPDNEHIKTYLQASESDPSKIGNSEERVK